MDTASRLIRSLLKTLDRCGGFLLLLILCAIWAKWRGRTQGRWFVTISYLSAVAREHGEMWGCFLCRHLDLFEEDHCDLALKAD